MATQSHSVRFMPLRREDMQDAAPVFSPTQVETKESVLHSVFSPTAKKASSRRRGHWISLDSYDNDAAAVSSQVPSILNVLSKRDSNSLHVKPSTHISNHVKSSSPRRPPHVQQIAATSSVDVSPLSATSNDVFFSPLSSPDLTSPKSATSGFTSKSSTSFKTLRDVTLLDVEKIEACVSVEDLKNVIQVLDGEGRFQALLRKAKSRYGYLLGLGSSKTTPDAANNHQTDHVINNKDRQSPRQESRHDVKPSPKRLPRSPATSTPNSLRNEITSRPHSNALEPPTNFPFQDSATRTGAFNTDVGIDIPLNETNESSLVMSLSSSVLDANLDENNYEQFDPSKKYTPYTLENRRLSATSAGQMVTSPSSGHLKSLHGEFKKLADTVLSMETARAADRKLFLEKLQSLEGKKDDDGENVKVVESLMQRSSLFTRDLIAAMEQLRAESQELQENVTAERKAWNNTYKAAQQLESRLCQKEQQLTEQLSAQPNESAKELEDLKKKYEAEITRKETENQQLANNLRQSLQQMLVGLGRDRNEVHSMTNGQQKEMLSSFAKQHLSSKAAMDAMAQEVGKIEQERREAHRREETASAKLKKCKHAQLQLERENKQLSQRIQNLSEELTNMRNYIEELSTNRHSREEWAEQEKKYQEIIRTLKKQLRREETMVSVGLYKAAVDSAREKGNEIDQRKKELEALKEKFSSLELQLKQKEKTHNDTVALTRQKETEEKASKQKLKELQLELQQERQNSRKAAAKAKQESEKHQSAQESIEALSKRVEDLQWELQESGSTFRENTMVRIPPQKGKSLQSTRLVVSTGKNLVSPSTTSPANNKENIHISPSTEKKQPLRSKFNFVRDAGGRKGLQRRVQQLRSSPRAVPVPV